MTQTSIAQTIQAKQWGGSAGLLCSIGTKVNRIGIKINLYAHIAQTVQGNLQWCGIYAINSYGPKIARFEQQLGIGLTGAWGKYSDTALDSLAYKPFLSPVSNQTLRPYSLGYAYLIYHDPKGGMSQTSGMIGFQANKVSFFCENDLFAGQGRDRYRTGAFGIYYTQNLFRFSLVNILFTPDPKGMPKVRDNAAYPARFGYTDFSQAMYASCSHGILALQMEYVLPYGQIVGVQSGVDSERIRHIIQNKFIHDMPFIPKRINRARNPDMPMIDKTGKLYLFKQEQQVKPPRFWGEIIVNTPNFY